MQNAKLKIKKILDRVRKEILSHQLVYLLLFFILLSSAFLRLYKLDKLLGFWYDQGRDALVVWDLLHHRKFFLIGPVTGIEGIFLGPFYYYLLAPLYWLGQGSPVFTTAGLSWLTVGAIFLIYYLTAQVYGRGAGLIASFLYGFSYNLVVFYSRWLANPNPLPFFSMLTLIFLWQAIKKDGKYLVLVGLLSGLCLQLEAASAIFFLPAILIILIWQRKKLGRMKLHGLTPVESSPPASAERNPAEALSKVEGRRRIKILFYSFLAFFATLLPQIIFNFRHQGILIAAFKKFLVAEKSFRSPMGLVVKTRLIQYYDSIFGKVFPGPEGLRLITLVLFFLIIFSFRKKIFSDWGKILVLWLIAPLIGFLFYQGNHGYFWDYYLTGVYPVFLIIFSAGLFFLSKQNRLIKILVGVFLLLFLTVNLRSLKTYYQTGIGITLRAQIWAIDWIYEDAKNEEFNVDFYVPPQIFYSYSYLFRWYGGGKYGREPETKLVKNLYTLSEPDADHPQFLAAWLKRQAGIGKIIKSDFWGDITVQKRERVKFDE